MLNIEKQNIIVTGASGGIGNSIVEKLDETGANILASGTKVEKLEDLNKQRRKNAARLTLLISKHSEYLETIEITDDMTPGYYGFPIFLKPNTKISRNTLCSRLESYGIETRPNMGGCLPDQPGFLNQQHRVHGDLSNARSIKENAFFIGVH